MKELHLDLTLADYETQRKQRLSDTPMSNKRLLEYLNETRGLMGDIISFAVAGTQITYKKNQ